MESHDSGADQRRSTQEKNGDRAGRHRLTVRATAGTRAGSTALRESEQTGHNRKGHTNGIRSDLADGAHSARRSMGKEHKQTARRAETDSTRTPKADKVPCLLCA